MMLITAKTDAPNTNTTSPAKSVNNLTHIPINLDIKLKLSSSKISLKPKLFFTETWRFQGDSKVELIRPKEK
jgi:hypothetical protein